MSEKFQPPPGSLPLLPTTKESSPPQPKQKQKRKLLLPCLFLYFLTLFTYDSFSRASTHAGLVKDKKEGACPKQVGVLLKGNAWNVSKDYPEFVAGRLSRAVQVPAESYDNMGAIGEDARWEAHYMFAAFLEEEFPKVFEVLEHEKINTHGHLFTWKGSDPSLKPVIFMAHEDVVPVLPATRHLWTYPPFQGKVADGFVWGRGAADCKNQLLGIMNAVEKLLLEGYTPERTILLSFGFDEEIGGPKGAKFLAETITARYGKDSVALIVDEGFGGLDEQYGLKVASLGMAEKGSVNFKVTVDTPGGHSSVPPVHTGIGYLSLLISTLESNPFPSTLTSASPFLKYLSCLAEYAPDVPKELKKAVESPKQWGKLAKKLAGESDLYRAFLGTTQATDLIYGGVKVNALPEKVEAIINHRIAFTSSVAETQKHTIKTISSLADSWGFSFTAFNSSSSSHSQNKLAATHKITLDWNEEGVFLEPAPLTPDVGGAFELMAGSIRGVWGEDVVVAPSGMFANTDTNRYWNLTRNIYRFAPAEISGFRNPHTVDEAMSVTGHVSTIEFFYTLIQNTEGWSE